MKIWRDHGYSQSYGHAGIIGSGPSIGQRHFRLQCDSRRATGNTNCCLPIFSIDVVLSKHLRHHHTTWAQLEILTSSDERKPNRTHFRRPSRAQPGPSISPSYVFATYIKVLILAQVRCEQSFSWTQEDTPQTLNYNMFPRIILISTLHDWLAVHWVNPKKSQQSP